MSFFPTAADLTAWDGCQAGLHAQALAATLARFNRRVFVRAVVEVSNFCRRNCHYCGMRRENRALVRARARAGELAELLIHHRPKAVTDVSIQAGEDPVAVREVVLPLISVLRRETDLGIGVCLGTLDRPICSELMASGASVYILKFETANAHDYEKKEAPGTLAGRLDHIHWLLANGWNVSSGFIVGLPGHDVTELVACCRMAGELPVHGCSVSPFVPGESTPLAAATPGDVDITLNCMAILRLMRPDWVIPAVSALNLSQPDGGYRRGLRAGANLVTINLTPRHLQQNYVIYKRDRFIMDEERVLAAIAAENLIPSPQSLAEFYRRKADCPTTEKTTAIAK
jgi:biotin synthase